MTEETVFRSAQAFGILSYILLDDEITLLLTISCQLEHVNYEREGEKRDRPWKLLWY